MDIIYEDHDIVVVNKPSGLLSVPGNTPAKHDSVETRIRDIYAGACAVHRLDMDTSGIIVLSKHKDAERYYKRQFAEHLAHKRYIAICHGHLEPKTGDMDFPLIVDWPNRPRQIVSYERGKPSFTHYEVLDYEGENTRVALYPKTGRSHQLRIHLATLEHPIIGDNLYAYAADADLPRLLLHAEHLELTKMDGTQLNLTVPAPF